MLSDFLLPLGTFPGSNSCNDIAVSMGTRLLQRERRGRIQRQAKEGGHEPRVNDRLQKGAQRLCASKMAPSHPKQGGEMCLKRNFCFPTESLCNGRYRQSDWGCQGKQTPLCGVLSPSVLEKFCHSSDPLPAAGRGDGDRGMLQSAAKASAVFCEWNVKQLGRERAPDLGVQS